MPFLLLSVAHSAEPPTCTAPVAPADLLATLMGMRAQYAAGSEEELRRSRQVALLQVECVREPFGPADAAFFHRSMAWAATAEGRREEAVASMRASLAIQPAPPSPRPEFDEIVAAAVQAGVPERVEHPGAGAPRVRVDGLADLALPAGGPCLLQLVDASGAVTDSRYSWEGPLPAIPVTLPAEAVGSTPVARPFPTRRVLMATGGGFMAVAGVSFTLSAIWWSIGDRPVGYTDAQVDAIHRQKEVGFAVAAVGVAAGVVTLAVSTRF